MKYNETVVTVEWNDNERKQHDKIYEAWKWKWRWNEVTMKQQCNEKKGSDIGMNTFLGRAMID